MRAAKLLLLFATACCGLTGCESMPEALPYVVRNDAIPEPLTQLPGDASRGRETVMGRDGNCLLCHAIPETGQRFMSNVAPPLSQVATRLSPGELRLRIVDPTRVNRDAAMPAYYRIEGLDRVARPFQGRPILSAQQVEDVVAYLSTLN